MAEPEGGLLTDSTDNQQQTTQWYPEEYGEKIVQKGWKAPTDAVKSYFELEKTMGGRIKLPTPQSSAEEIRAFYQKTGCPENPDGYEIKVPEGAEMFRDEDIEKNLRQVAYDMGVSKQAFETIVSKYYDQLATGAQMSRQEGETSLRQELGAKYDTELAIAKRFCDTCSPEFKELLDISGLGNNPVVVKEFISIGKKTMSDTLIKGGQPEKEEYIPVYKDSPEMYATGEDDESKKARAYFEAKGYRYST